MATETRARAWAGDALPASLALVLRLAVWLMVPTSRFESDEASYYHAGLSLLAGGHQDLFWPPMTGWIVASAAWALGTTALPAIRLVWIALDTSCVFAIGTLARRVASAAVGSDPRRAARIARWATLGYAVYLPAISFAQFTTSEVPALAQLLAILVLIGGPVATFGASAAAGLATGTLVLTRPSLLPLLAALPWWVWRRHRLAHGVRHALLMIGLASAVVIGLVCRNGLVAGEFTIARNSAYNLYVGNRDFYAEDLNLFNPRATPEQIEFRRQFFSNTLQYPTESPETLQREALAWIEGHPVLFARRAAGRLARVLAPKTDVLELAGGETAAGIFSPLALVLLSVANAQWAVVLFAGVAGLTALRRLNPPLGSLLTITIAGSLLLCLVAIAKPRYSFVFDPLLLIGAAVCVTAPRSEWATLSQADRMVAFALMAFLLWGWMAWGIFAVSSRMALAGAA